MSEQPSITPLDMSGANGPLFAALAKAQQAAATVGKDGTNTQKNYKYASAEAMIRGAREAMKECNLAVVSTWTTSLPTVKEGPIGKQFTCATVTEHWVVGHSDGGYIQGKAQMEAIASGGRPYEKAVAATASYMHGFVLRHILNLDRADEEAYAVDRRPDVEDSSSSGPPEPSAEWKAAYAKFQPVAKMRADLIQEHGVKGYMSPGDRIADVLGVKHAPHQTSIVTGWWPHIIKAFHDDIRDIKATVARDAVESEEGPGEAAQ